MADDPEKTELKANAGLKVEAGVKRGQQSWTFVYVWLAIAISIESALLELITVKHSFPYTLIVFVFVIAGTLYLFILNGWFINKLIGLRNWYENRSL